MSLPGRRTQVFVAGGLLVALLLGGVVSHWASSEPDGLDKVAGDTGLDSQEQAHELDGSPLAGYQTDGIDSSAVSGGVAGVIGVTVCFLVGGGIAWALRRRQPVDADQP